MKKIIFIVISMLLISIMLISSYFLIKNFKEEDKQKNIFTELSNIATKRNEQTEENQIDLEKLYKINNDIVGWLKIDNTNINYPIMQTRNKPNFYLDKNFYKEYSFMGTPYIDENCDIENSNNIIIYGHHIKGNKMLGELENYKSEEYYKNHKIIKFYTRDTMIEYEIISVFKTTVYDNVGFKYYQFYNMEKEREFNTFVNKCKELSFYEIKETAKFGNKLITLSTCEYSKQNGRLVVIAKQIS